MIRIRTMIGKLRVYTLFFNGKWVTLYNGWGDSLDATTLLEAGQNHLRAASHMKAQADKSNGNDSDR